MLRGSTPLASDTASTGIAACSVSDAGSLTCSVLTGLGHPERQPLAVQRLDARTRRRDHAVGSALAVVRDPHDQRAHLARGAWPSTSNAVTLSPPGHHIAAPPCAVKPESARESALDRPVRRLTSHASSALIQRRPPPISCRDPTRSVACPPPPPQIDRCGSRTASNRLPEGFLAFRFSPAWRGSSGVEQGSHKPLVGSSNLPSATSFSTASGLGYSQEPGASTARCAWAPGAGAADGPCRGFSQPEAVSAHHRRNGACFPWLGRFYVGSLIDVCGYLEPDVLGQDKS